MSLRLNKSTWTRVALGEVAQASKERVDPTDGTVDRFIAGEHMDSDDLKIRRWGNVGDIDLGPAFHRRFRPGQVLYGSRRTYLRKVAVAEFDGVCANTTFVIEPFDASILLPDFLPFIMSSEPFHAFAIAESKGSVNPYVNWSDIARYEFGLPGLHEQRRIADLLWAAEAALTHQRMLHESAAALRRRFVDDRVDWMVNRETAPFAALWADSPESGWSAAPVDQDTGFYVLSLAALGPEGYRPGNLKNIMPSANARAAILRKGDLLVSRANTIDSVGRVGIYPEGRTDVSFPDTMMRLRLRDSVLPAFAEAVISSAHGRRHMKRTAAGSATSMVKINRISLGKFQFPIATQSEQARFLSELAVINYSVSRIAEEIQSLSSFKSALLADIFGGA